MLGLKLCPCVCVCVSSNESSQELQIWRKHSLLVGVAEIIFRQKGKGQDYTGRVKFRIGDALLLIRSL